MFNLFTGNKKSNRWVRLKDYQKKSGATFREVYPEIERNIDPPPYFGEKEADFNERLDLQIPALGVTEIKNASVFRDGWVIGEKDQVIVDFSWYVSDIQTKAPPEFPRISEHYHGRGLNLTSTFSLMNHGHFLVDTLSRIHLLEKAGYALEDFDYIYCPEPFHAFHEVLYHKLGIDKYPLIHAGNKRRIRFDTLIATSFPGIKSKHPVWVPEFLRSSILEKPYAEKRRRIYINRHGYKRQITNEKEFFQLLADYHFENIDPLSVRDQHLLFSEMEVMVTIHGSALANIVFCQPGAKILDLMPENHVTSFAYSLAQAGGLEYYYLLCGNVARRAAGAIGPDYSDFTVDIPALEAALRQLCAK
jgi:capsular polysaccharide biosynthesis protein